ncbi:MAG: 16S rRNA pseudouridine(516) synthase RsuA [Pseudomonadales bacterium]|nr:16S rRNA pseudouridine(516) synthase RsuA [Pseudomonadales bacterium]
MRLDKFIAHATGLTRQQVQRAVRAGEVCVNGVVQCKPQMHLQTTDSVMLRGELLQGVAPRYFMLHKPVGYVCANSDGHHPVVLDLLHEPRRDGLQIVGRLDIDTTGLVLLTDDGAWNHRVTSPASACHKRYRVKLAESLSSVSAEVLRNGVLLDGEKHQTRPAQLTVVNATSDEVLLVIQEGKYHQVKRMFAAVGNHVLTLHRESIGDIALDTMLQPGEYRALTADEVASVK